MSLRSILSRCSSTALLEALAGVAPDVIPEDEDRFSDFAHGMEASISLFHRQVDAGMIAPDHLGIPEDVELRAAEGDEDALRAAVLRAIYEEASRSLARRADRSGDIVPEPVETSPRVFLVGDLGFYAELLECFGEFGFGNFNASAFPIVMAPRQRGGAFGFETILRSREEIGDDIDLLIMGALREVDSGHDLEADTLLCHDGVDYRDMLSFADDDERRRLGALAEARARGHLATDGDLRRSFRYRALRRSLADRIVACMEDTAYGRFTRNVLGDAVAWHYSTDSRRALGAALLPLLGDRPSGIPARLAAAVRRMTVVVPWDAASPRVVLVPETLAGGVPDALPGPEDLVISRVSDDATVAEWGRDAADSLCVERVRDLEFLKPVFLEGKTLEQCLEELK